MESRVLRPIWCLPRHLRHDLGSNIKVSLEVWPLHRHGCRVRRTSRFRIREPPRALLGVSDNVLRAANRPPPRLLINRPIFYLASEFQIPPPSVDRLGRRPPTGGRSRSPCVTRRWPPRASPNPCPLVALHLRPGRWRAQLCPNEKCSRRLLLQCLSYGSEHLVRRRKDTQDGESAALKHRPAVDIHSELPVRATHHVYLNFEFAPDSRRHTGSMQTGHSVCA